MSLKDLFNNLNSSIISSGSANKLAEEIESAEYLQSYSKLRDKLRTHTDFSKPENFSKFGSAEKYYIDAIERIYRTYPYDGSLQEKVQWELSSSGIDLYMFDEEYPRTNGFANFVVAPAETGAEGTYFFPSSGDDEYITVKGGPNTSSRKKNKDVDDTSGDYKDGYANIYDLSNNRESNLKIDGTDGNTIEFWLKKDGWVDDAKGQDYFEFVFDTHASGTVFGDHNFARFTVGLATTGTVGNSSKKPIIVRYYSGSSGDSPYLGSSTLTTASIADGTWHHYAVRVKTSGSNTIFDLFVDGEYNDSSVKTGATLDYVSGNTVAVIGAQASSFFDGTAERGATGWSKLSGSLDEVRFWKTWRTAEQIGRQYIEPVGAGSNTDTANTDLGVYYKFNEGITLTSSVDSTVLDYSGRISNGTWTGYDSTQSRSTGSAIVLSGKAEREFKDPILYNFHPEVQDLVAKKTNIGKEYDYRNANSIYNSMPAWITELDNTKNAPPLKNLTQIIANYFDTLSNEIENITKLKEVNYASGTLSNFDKPFFFNDRVLQGSGFPYIPELFSDASFFEFFRNRTDTKLFEEKLYDVKNTIYRNIYNNLVYINKSKGTEKAFRNMLRCFGFDDEIYKIRHYATDAVHEFRDNYKSIVGKKNYVNFALTASAEATVYQYQTDSNTTSFITASYSTTGAEASGFAFSAESQVVFPIIGTQAEHNTLIKSKDRSSVYETQKFVTDKEGSLFGMRSVNNGPASQENDLTVPTNDRTGFVVKVIRNNSFDKRAYFKLEPANSTSYFPTITSSYFEDVFDNTKWNFAVVVQPERYGQFDTVSGSEDTTYDVIFYGINSVLDDVRNSFALSSSISKAYGQTILSTPKRFFAGALRENITGSLVTRSNAYISDCRFWLSPLSLEDVKRHNFDFENYGIEKPYQSTFLFQSSGSKTRVPRIETLALHWDFSNLTSSNTTGEFDVSDLSSGSSYDGRFNTISDTLSRQHAGRGFSFLTSSIRTFEKKSVYNARTELPEYVNSSDMVFIRDQDDATFTRSTSPTTYVMSFEKSMYQTVSEEMLKIFSTVADYGSMVGDRSNEFRLENKHLTKLRQMFFESVSNTPKIEKYVDYYRWLDSGLNVMLSNLVPATAITFDDENLIRPIIEEYIFNRNKYDHKFPTLEFKQTDPTGHILGIREGLYNYRFGNAPASSKGVAKIGKHGQNDHCLWWNKRAERDLSGSGNVYVDLDRQRMLDVRNNLNNASPPILSGASGAYSGSVYAIRNFARPYRFQVQQSKLIHGGTNFHPTKKPELFKDVTRLRNLANATNYMHFPNGGVDLEPTGCNDNTALRRNVDVAFKIQLYPESAGSDTITAEGANYLPFNIVSSSATAKSFYLKETAPGRVITNIHHDAYGPDYETPMQGPFTEKYVGGNQHRHAPLPALNHLDTIMTRAEAWSITDEEGSNEMSFLTPQSSTLGYRPKAPYYRDEVAKRPVNVRNIQTKTGSYHTATLGNYHQSHEIVNTSGRRENNRFLAESYAGVLLTGSSEVFFFSGALDYTLPRRDLTGSNKYIIVNRFSSPGDPSTMSEGFLDVASAEYSVYNALPWRNLAVRKPLQELLSDHVNKGGFFSDWFRLQTYSGSGIAYPGGTGSINQNITTASMGTGSFHKNHRNNVLQLRYSNEHVDDSAITNATSSFDNYYVRHQIPRSDLQYAWITGSVVSADGTTYTGSVLYGFEKPDFSNASFASTDLTFVSGSDVVSVADDTVHNPYRYFGQDKKFASPLTTQGPPYTGTIFTDFVGLNTIVQEALTSSMNLLGFPNNQFGGSRSSYINFMTRVSASFGRQYVPNAAANARVLNSILLNRAGPWGSANWKLYKKDSHAVVRTHRGENRISFVTSSKNLVRFVEIDTRNNESVIKTEWRTIQGFTSSIEPPVNSKHSPVTFDLDIQTAINGGQTRVTFKQSYLNNFTRFSDKVDDLYDLNNGQAFEFLENYPEKKLSYDTLVTLITDDTISDKTNPINKVNSITTRETIYPREKNTYLGNTRKRVAIDTNWNDIRWKRQTLNTHVQPGSEHDPFLSESNSYGLQYSASAWPLDARCVNQFLLCFPDSAPVAGSSDGASGYTQIFSGSNRLGYNQEGVLQNDAAQYFRSGTFDEVNDVTGTLLPIYSRRVISYNDQNSKFYLEGDAAWEVGSQAGVNPYYDSYDDYVDDIMRMGKGHGILPEFRISEHMDFYLNTKGGDFLAENTASLTLTGAIYANEAEDGFVVNYKHSDFLKAFNVVDEDFGEKIPATKLELECDAILKFLPYKGLYPVERTLELAKMFFEDYQEVIFFTSSRAPSVAAPLSGTILDVPGKTILARPIAQTLFAPGILYNSIKSGHAVDFPFMTSSFEVSGSSASNQFQGKWIKNIPRIAGVTDSMPYDGGTSAIKVFGDRLPFETLATPDEELAKRSFVDYECHPSAKLNVTASILGAGKPTYRFAMNNFLASTIDFWRPDGRMATLASLPDNDPSFGIFDEEKTYGMAVWLTNGKMRSYNSISSLLDGGKYATPHPDHFAWRLINPPSVVMYERSASVESCADLKGSGFGPPVDIGVPYSQAYIAGTSENLKLHSSASYGAHCPPWYGNGVSWTTITFHPPRTDKFTLEEIIPLLSASSQTFGKMQNVQKDTYYNDLMPMSSSLNLLQTAKRFGVKFSPAGAPEEIDSTTEISQMVMQPKWECPVLDFANVDITMPTLGSGSVPRGMWHQFGEIPSAGNGIMMQVQDVDPGTCTTMGAPSTTWNLTSSLADALGFKKEPVRIGEVAEEKEIFEAVVAIPHVLQDAGNEKGTKSRFAIPRETIDISSMILRDGGLTDKTLEYIENVGPDKKPTKEIVDMVQKMKKYVFPPRMDFVTNKTIEPFAMFIFEFSTVLSQDDLSHIWQNVMPKIGTSAQKSKASLPINLFKSNDENGTSMIDAIPENIQWSVFKVKQRSSYNYFTKTADSKDDGRFKFNFEIGSRGAEKQSEPDYSFNWPYDFFSLVELARVDCKVEFGTPYVPESFPYVEPEPPRIDPPAEERLTPSILVSPRAGIQPLLAGLPQDRITLIAPTPRTAAVPPLRSLESLPPSTPIPGIIDPSPIAAAAPPASLPAISSGPTPAALYPQSLSMGTQIGIVNNLTATPRRTGPRGGGSRGGSRY